MKLTFPILLTALYFCCSVSSCQSQTFTPRFVESDQPVVKIKEGKEFTFGYLEVLEDRSKPDGTTIKLPVYIFKSRSDQQAKDPIIYTVGGPGSSTMRSAQYTDYYSYLDDRDFIFFEQRGTYYAQPHLDCPEWSKALYDANFPEVTEQQKDSLLQKAATDCRDKLEARGIDLNSYNTKAIAADIADLVKALDIKTYNLLTISYSTKIAQVLMRDFPHGIRSVVMDSPLPLEVNYDEESVQNLIASYDKLFADCAANLDCNKTFPDLKNRFFSFLEEKTENPLAIKVKNPNDDKELSFYLRGKDIVNLLGTPYTSDVPDFPSAIHNLISGDVSYLQESIQYLIKSPGNGNGTGMRLSVWCAEETPFASAAIIDEETQKYPAVKGMSPALYDTTICNIWGVKKVDALENKAIKSNIPTLLISGEYDNETPSRWATQMQKNLENSHHLIFKGWNHTPTTNWGNKCAMQLANAFFNTPDKKPELDCFEQIKSPKFVTPTPEVKVEQPKLVAIKGGTFMMGQANGEGDEGPVHQVTIDDFSMGQYEVTVAQYRVFCEATNRTMPKEPAWGWIDKHPIINTSWNDAMAYINWLNETTGEQYRLPTEAEFDYVIRNGGKPGIYPWGNGMPLNENIADESLKKVNPSRNIWKGYDDGFANTSPVGSFQANELGVYDINGNAWEWCSDWYGPFPMEAVNNPKGPANGKHKVGKGASYNADPWHARSASRSYVKPDFEGPGFRLAKD